MTEIDDYSARVLDVVDAIPPGQVMSYGDIAEYLGAGGPRQVGRVLARYGGGAPWWRVIHADGTPAPGHDAAALVKAGQLMRVKAQSQVSTTAHFGGGPAAVAAAPVTARGSGWYKVFVVLMIMAGIVVLAGGVGLFLTQGARRS